MGNEVEDVARKAADPAGIFLDQDEPKPVAPRQQASPAQQETGDEPDGAEAEERRREEALAQARAGRGRRGRAATILGGAQGGSGSTRVGTQTLLGG